MKVRALAIITLILASSSVQAQTGSESMMNPLSGMNPATLMAVPVEMMTAMMLIPMKMMSQMIAAPMGMMNPATMMSMSQQAPAASNGALPSGAPAAHAVAHVDMEKTPHHRHPHHHGNQHSKGNVG